MNIKSEENIPFFLYFPIFYYFCVEKNYLSDYLKEI